MLEPAGAGQPFPRAFLRIAGASLAQHQLGLAIALGCQRMICLARGSSPELIALQHAAEAAGMRFNMVAGPQQLSALVTATDELVVITEGLFADATQVAPMLEGGSSVVLALPDDGAIAEGFERLDINNVAAGLMKVPGSLIERLHDLPPDCDTASALTRLALQSGAKMHQVPAEARDAANWRMVRSESEALAIESQWLRTRLAVRPKAAPSDRLARVGVLSFGSSLLHAGNASGVAALSAIVALVLALCSAWLQMPVLAFALAAVTWVLVRATGLLRGAERQAYNVLEPAIPRADVMGWLVDFGLVLICVLASGQADASLTVAVVSDRIFAPLMLVLMLHLAPRLLEDGLSAWTCDRGSLAVLLGLAAGLGYLGLVIRLLAVGLTVASILLPPRRLH
jgi:hypothetical protein